MILSSNCVFAWPDKPLDVQRFEGSLKLGFGTPLNGISRPALLGWGVGDDGETQYFPVNYQRSPRFGFTELGLELRYNLPSSAFDVGAALTIQGRRFSEKIEAFEYKSTTYGTVFIGVLGDYNFSQGRKVNPYVGLQLGMGLNDTYFMAAPRIGVELWHHLRVESIFYLGAKEVNMFSISIGATIGGKPKKK